MLLVNVIWQLCDSVCKHSGIEDQETGPPVSLGLELQVEGHHLPPAFKICDMTYSPCGSSVAVIMVIQTHGPAAQIV